MRTFSTAILSMRKTTIFLFKREIRSGSWNSQKFGLFYRQNVIDFGDGDGGDGGAFDDGVRVDRRPARRVVAADNALSAFP